MGRFEHAAVAMTPDPARGETQTPTTRAVRALDGAELEAQGFVSVYHCYMFVAE